MDKKQRELRDMVLDIAKNQYAWPGGYERLLITADGGLVCSECVKANLREIISDIRDNFNCGWLPAATCYEGGSLDWCLEGRKARLEREEMGLPEPKYGTAQQKLESREDYLNSCSHCYREFGELS